MDLDSDLEICLLKCFLCLVTRFKMDIIHPILIFISIRKRYLILDVRNNLIKEE